MSAMKNSKHIVGIDLIRFLAACLVLAFHYCFLMGINPNGLVGSASKKNVAFPELYSYSNFGWIGVQIFFVISGFVIAFSGEKASSFSFLRSRIVRLGPAVWICAPITLVVTAMAGFRAQADMLRSFRHSMLFLPWEPWIDGSYWTLGIEISFYAAVLAIIRFSKFENIRYLAISLGVISSLIWGVKTMLALGGSPVFLEKIYWLPDERISQLLLIDHGVFFAIGVILWTELIKKHSVENYFWLLLFIFGGCAQIVAQSGKANEIFDRNYSAIIPCLIWLISIALIVWSVRSNAAAHRFPGWMIESIKTLGMMTYPLYLLHQIVGAAIMGWMVSYGLNRWTALFGSTAIIFLMTWLIAKRLEPLLQSVTRYMVDSVHARFFRAPFSRDRKS